MNLELVVAIATSPRIASTVRVKGFGVADTAEAAASARQPRSAPRSKVPPVPARPSRSSSRLEARQSSGSGVLADTESFLLVRPTPSVYIYLLSIWRPCRKFAEI